MTNHTTAKDDTADRLIDALNQDGFILYRQRITALRPDREAYQEILVRFKEEEEKLLPPGTFIPVLESSHLMHILDRWVLNRVIKWIHARRRTDPLWNAPCSSINLSNDSLASRDFPDFVRTQLEKGKISGRKVAFEIPEEDAASHAAALERLTSILVPLGCRFTLTSYSGNWVSLEQLKPQRIDSVKIDVALSCSMHVDSTAYSRAHAIQTYCDAHDVSTLGELVEQAQTLEKLKGLGVHFVQGYGIAMPEPLA